MGLISSDNLGNILLWSLFPAYKEIKDYKSYQLIREYQQKNANISCLTLTNDNSLIITTCNDKKIRE
jgi:hypothetical protein